MRKIKVYTDTNILSRIPDPNTSQKILDVLEKLSEIEHIDFVTSAKTNKEICKTSNRNKLTRLKLLYKLMAKIKVTNIKDFRPALLGVSTLGSMAYGGMDVEVPLFCALKKIFDKDDSEHIFHAIKAQCDYFLTLDQKTILNRVKKRHNYKNQGLFERP